MDMENVLDARIFYNKTGEKHGLQRLQVQKVEETRKNDSLGRKPIYQHI